MEEEGPRSFAPSRWIVLSSLFNRNAGGRRGRQGRGKRGKEGEKEREKEEASFPREAETGSASGGLQGISRHFIFRERTRERMVEHE